LRQPATSCASGRGRFTSAWRLTSAARFAWPAAQAAAATAACPDCGGRASSSLRNCPAWPGRSPARRRRAPMPTSIRLLARWATKIAGARLADAPCTGWPATPAARRRRPHRLRSPSSLLPRASRGSIRRLSVVPTPIRRARLDRRSSRWAGRPGGTDPARPSAASPGCLRRGFVSSCRPAVHRRGRELFLSRAVSSARGRTCSTCSSHSAPAAGRDARRHARSLRWGLVTRSLTPVHTTLGAGVLAGTSNLYHLRTAQVPATDRRCVRRPSGHGGQPPVLTGPTVPRSAKPCTL